MAHIDVQALADLARLEVTGEELTKLQKEIPDILSFVDAIQKASGAVKRDANALHNVMRADVNPHESGHYTEKILEAAPARQGDRIAVKRVLSRKK